MSLGVWVEWGEAWVGVLGQGAGGGDEDIRAPARGRGTEMSRKDLRTRSGTPTRGSWDSGRRLGLDVGAVFGKRWGAQVGNPLRHSVTEMVGWGHLVQFVKYLFPLPVLGPGQVLPESLETLTP